MHRFPDRPSLRIKGRQHFKDLRRAGFAGFRDIKSFLVSAKCSAHRVSVDDHAAQPVVRLGIFKIHRIHAHRQISQPLLIIFIESFFLGDMLFQMRKLPADNTRYDITHPVVVAQLFVLIPRSILAGLR